MSDVASVFLEGAVRTATPLALAATGELVAERSGVINLALEGSIIAGALGAFIGADHLGLLGGWSSAVAAGIIVAAIMALFTVVAEANQIIAGTAVSLLAAGLTGTIYRTFYGAAGAALRIPTSAPLTIPVLSRIPLIGSAVFAQQWITYVAIAVAAAVGWWLWHTHEGLATRGVGENPEAARSAGVSPGRIRFLSLLFCGALGGLAGGSLVLAQVGTFAEGMSAGRGFIAVAIVSLGRWRPLGTMLAALLFGAASALQYFFQALDWRVPYQLFLAVPYVLTLVALAMSRRGTPPAWLGR